MQPLYRYISEFYQKEFRSLYFILVLLMMGILIYFNYGQGLEAKYIKSGRTGWSHFMGYYFLYLIPFALAFFLQSLFFKEVSYFRKYWFWIILLLAPTFFSLKVNFNYQEILIKKNWSGHSLRFWLESLGWVVRAIVVLIPVYFIWIIKDKANQPFYGTTVLKNIKPYLVMMLIMVPLIALASMQKDFQEMYPRARFLTELNLPSKKLHYFFYELCYGFDFVSIEFFFRGFLILSLIKICGSHCIIPAACFYCTIHFGKPMGEAISSFWGGLLLGIISYNTRSIWGGLIVHLGIAWLMETAGWIAFILNS